MILTSALRLPIRRRRFPWLLTSMSLLIVFAILSPLLLVIIQAAQSGWGNVWSLVDQSFVAGLLWNTIRLALVVTVLCAVIGTGFAWLTERTDLPRRKLWTVLLIVPIVIPDFVLAWTWSSVFPLVHGYFGAALVMTLHLYPLVYLPMAAAFRVADPGQEEAARTLGVSRRSAWMRITVRQARPTLMGGCLLVCLALLSYYGAFEDLRYETFTTAIFGALRTQFSTIAACALSLVLVAMSIVVLGGEGFFRERGHLQRPGAMAQRLAKPIPLGRWRPLVLVEIAALVILALGFPIAIVVYWMVAGGTSTLPAAVSLGSALAYTTSFSALGAIIATVMALPVALLASRHARRWSVALGRTTFIIQAVPGIVVALALVYVTSRYTGWLYQSPELLIASYALMFFPFALVALSASVARASAALEETGRVLGKGPVSVRLTVTLPLLTTGLAAAFCFVFLSAVTELTATLLLVPTGVQTLATQFWTYAEEGASFGTAAPYAAMMMLLSAVPAYFLGKWFGRVRASGSRAEPSLIEAIS